MLKKIINVYVWFLPCGSVRHYSTLLQPLCKHIAPAAVLAIVPLETRTFSMFIVADASVRTIHVATVALGTNVGLVIAWFDYGEVSVASSVCLGYSYREVRLQRGSTQLVSACGVY